MKGAGIGYRAAAGEASLLAALEAAGGSDGVAALATIAGKEGGALASMAARLGLPVVAVCERDLAAQRTETASPRIEALTGAGSVAEAAALAVAGPDARLVAPRAVSPDRMATAAIAVSGDDA